MFLGEKQLSGEIPRELGDLASLTSLYLGEGTRGVEDFLRDVAPVEALVDAESGLAEAGGTVPQGGDVLLLTAGLAATFTSVLGWATVKRFCINARIKINGFVKLWLGDRQNFGKKACIWQKGVY